MNESSQGVCPKRRYCLPIVRKTLKWRMEGVSGFVDLATLSIAASGLIVLPLFTLQVGVALTAPLTAHVIRSLGPVCVFVLEQVDGRLVYSTPTLICIVFYSAAVIASNLAHGWKGRAIGA